jgi:hypothetical protein
MCERDQELVAGKERTTKYLEHAQGSGTFDTGPSTLGLLEQRNKIITHLKKKGITIPKHLVSASSTHLPLSHQQPSVHLTYLLMWVSQQGIVLLPDFCKTRKHSYRFASLQITQLLRYHRAAG